MQGDEKLVQIVLAVETVDRITQEGTAAVAVDGDLDVVGFEKIAF